MAQGERLRVALGAAKAGQRRCEGAQSGRGRAGASAQDEVNELPQPPPPAIEVEDITDQRLALTYVEPEAPVEVVAPVETVETVAEEASPALAPAQVSAHSNTRPLFSPLAIPGRAGMVPLLLCRHGTWLLELHRNRAT